MIVVGLVLGAVAPVAAYAPTEREQRMPVFSEENNALEKLESPPAMQAMAATEVKLASANQSSGSLRLYVDAQPRRARRCDHDLVGRGGTGTWDGAGCRYDGHPALWPGLCAGQRHG